MKFTKTAVAVAIAGIAAAPMIASADTTLSGDIQIQVEGDDGDDDSSDPTVAPGDVLFGIVAEHELNSGLTGYGSLRVDLDRLSNATGDAVDANGEAVKTVGSTDSTYVGIKGGFGDFRLGEIPLAIEYAQVANDIYDIGSEVNGGLSYTGSFGPVSLIGNFSPEQNSDVIGLGAKFTLGGFAIGLGGEERASLQNVGAGVSFAFAGASIAAHFATLEVDGSDDDTEVMAAQVGYGFGGVSAKVTYTTEINDGSDIDNEAIRLDLGYGLGGGLDLSTRITSETDNAADTDGVEWRVQLAKSF